MNDTTAVVEIADSFRAAEFFAGIGLARLALERTGVRVAWSNDISEQKEAMFRAHFPESNDHTFALQDLGKVSVAELPEQIDLAWASFPCTDLSLAGGRAGIHKGIASSTFWHFIKVLSALGNRRPRIVALENVTAFATSHSGKDIESAILALNGLGYSVDVLSIDAKRFVPQSRPRLFLVAALDPPSASDHQSTLRPSWLDPIFSNPSLRTHRAQLPDAPITPEMTLGDAMEDMEPHDERWWDADRVSRFTESLAPLQATRFQSLLQASSVTYRTAYRRMRDGVPRWELRRDELAGCLRTARGGSSQQAVVHFSDGGVRIRWMTPLEYARLMGAGDFTLDSVAARQAYNGFGDAVCVPVVEWLSYNYLVPELRRTAQVVDHYDLPTGLEPALA